MDDATWKRVNTATALFGLVFLIILYLFVNADKVGNISNPSNPANRQYATTTINSTVIISQLEGAANDRIIELVLKDLHPYNGNPSYTASGRIELFKVSKTCFGRKFLWFKEHFSFNGFDEVCYPRKVCTIDRFGDEIC